MQLIYDILSRNEIYKNSKYAIPDGTYFEAQDAQLEYLVWSLIKKKCDEI